jgi:hypothetical protein
MSNGLQDRREHAQAELALHIGEIKSPDMVGSLWNGLVTLQKLLLTRLHIDFAAEFGVDSSLAPATAGEAIREMRHAAEAIETYSLVLVIDEVARRGYAKANVNWFRDWLLQLRFGDEVVPTLVERMRSYDKLSDGQRRRLFASSLEQALPEARQAPLIIYRLFPRAVRIATALAFGDALRAREIRKEQISYLPAIGDCHHCHGLPLENGETCVECGNPLWKIKWLNATE